MLARGQITAGLVAQVVGGRLVGNPGVVVRTIGGIESKAEGTLTFIRAAGFAGKWATSACPAALVSQGVEVPGHDASTRALIFVPSADLALATILHLLTPTPIVTPGVHASAAIDPSAKVDASASIGPGCVLGRGCEVGAGAALGPHVVLGDGVKIGPRTRIAPRVTIGDRCTIGADCEIASGVVIGTDGFGYRPDESGRLVKLPHLGGVVIEDRVEIGANTCVDRGRFGDTRIGAGTKIDNLVQIAHNVEIGRDVIICGNAGVGGSVVIGDRAVLGGGCGIADNVIIGAGAQLAAQAGVMDEVPPGARVGGYPAIPARDWMKHLAIMKRLAAGKGLGNASDPQAHRVSPRTGERRPRA